MAEDGARLTALSIRRTDDGVGAFRLETPFGESVQVMPRPPRFQATVSFVWDGAMPDEIADLVARARASGITVDAAD